MRKRELLRKIKNAETIELVDYSSHCPYLSCDGGKYYFGILWEKDGDYYNVRYYTSSSFPYCEKDGYFRTCDECSCYDEEQDECLRDYEKDDLKKILQTIINFIDFNYPFNLYVDNELIIECEEHEPGYCSYCDYEFSDNLYWFGGKFPLDRKQLSKFLKETLKEV